MAKANVTNIMGKHHFPWTDAFLAALRQMPVLAHAANAVGIDRSTAWRRMKADKDFAAAVEDAMESGIDRAELEAFRRGVVGFDELVVYQGRVCMTHVLDADGNVVLDDKGEPRLQPLTVRKHSDALLALTLKGRRKKVYAERTELTGADGADLNPAVDETQRTARLQQLLAAAQERKAADDFSDLA